MRVNKKAILGMLVAMVVSLGMMNGINNKNNDLNLQQVSLSSAAASGGEYNGYTVVSNIAGGAAGYFYYAGLASVGTGVGAPVGVANFLLGGICTL